MAPHYYQLVAALPVVPYFRRATRLPMSRLRLEQRLGLLEARDRQDLLAAESLVSWSRHPVSRTTADLSGLHDRVTAGLRSEALRQFTSFRMDLRTVMVALRLRRRGQAAPPAEVWGIGPYVRMIEARWGEADFGLSAVFPWLPEAGALLERGHAMELEGLLMDQSWRALSRLADRAPFGFPHVFATVFKLDILQRWLSYDAKVARARFEQLILEVTRDHRQLFD